MSEGLTYELEGVKNVKFTCEGVEVTVLCDPFGVGEPTEITCKMDERVFMDMSREVIFPF